MKRVQAARALPAPGCCTVLFHPRTLNKTSTKPVVYGERFVKRRGLFSLAVAPRHGVVSGCVSRQGNDRSAVHQLDQDRSGRRAGGGNAVAAAGLADFRSW